MNAPMPTGLLFGSVRDADPSDRMLTADLWDIADDGCACMLPFASASRLKRSKAVRNATYAVLADG